MKQSNNETIKIVFFGGGIYVLPILEVLKKNFDVPLVLTTEHFESEPISKFCKENKIQCFCVQQFNNETILTIKGVDAPFAILANFGLIVPKEVLNSFSKGIINVHPSLLPKYRGPTPAQTAILNGEKITGVTLIKLDDKIDHGPIIAQKEEAISSQDTAGNLYKRLFEIGAKLLQQNINQYIKGLIKVSEQNHSKATFTKILSRKSGFINIETPPSPKIIERMIRAYYPWPGVWTKFPTRSDLVKEEGKIIKFLPGQKLQVEGRKPMSYKEFVNGYQNSAIELLNKLGLYPNPL